MNWRRFLHPLVILAVALLVLCVVAETHFMPGPLSENHADIEGNCGACHPGFKGTPDASCLACKGKMKFDPNSGIHRYGPKRRCAACHNEHNGRNFPLATAWINPADFNHDWTGCGLDDVHRGVACQDCHPWGWKPGKHITCVKCHPKAGYKPKDVCQKVGLPIGGK